MPLFPLEQVKMAQKPVENKVIVLPPPPRQKGSIALTKMHHIRAELATLYREARTGKIDLGDATKLTYILREIGRVIEGSDLEQRIEQLEQNQKENKDYDH